MAEDHLTVADYRGLIIFAAFVYLAIRFVGAIAQVLLVFGIILLAILILNPVVTWLEKHKIPRAVAAFSIALAILCLFGFVAWLTVPRMVKEFWGLASDIPSYVIRLRDWLSTKYPGFAKEIPNVSSSMLVRQGLDRIVPFLGGITGYAITIGDVLVSAIVILICTIYGLSDPRSLVQGFFALMPQRYRETATEIVRRLGVEMRSWAIATVIGMFLIFLLTWVSLALLGLRSAFLIGLVAGALEIVPVLGPFVSGSFATLIALGQDPGLAVWVLLIFVGIQQVEGHLIIPLVMSGQLKLHPISVVFAVLVMGGLYGIVGIFLASPVAATIKVLVYELYVKPRSDTTDGELEKAAEQVVSGESSEPPEDAEHKESESG